MVRIARSTLLEDARRWLPQGAECECQLGRRLQLEPRQLRERLERRQCLPLLLRFMRFLPLSFGGSFVCETFFPTAKHAADLIERYYERRITFLSDNPMLPAYLQEEFEHIRLGDGLRYQRQLFKLVICEASSIDELQKGQKYIVYPGPDCVAINAR